MIRNSLKLLSQLLKCLYEATLIRVSFRVYKFIGFFIYNSNFILALEISSRNIKVMKIELLLVLSVISIAAGMYFITFYLFYTIFLFIF